MMHAPFPITPDEKAVREFTAIIHEQAKHAFKGVSNPGCLQLNRLWPGSTNIQPQRFNIGQVDEMADIAFGDATAGFNVYLEGRTVRADTAKRGKHDDTVGV